MIDVLHPFGPQQRLQRAREFRQVLTSRRFRMGQWFVAHWQAHLPNASCTHLVPAPGGSAGARLGLVVGKRWAKQAVARNRIKRICRDTFRLRLSALPRVDVVLRLHRRADKHTPARELRQDIQGLLDRIDQECASKIPAVMHSAP